MTPSTSGSSRVVFQFSIHLHVLLPAIIAPISIPHPHIQYGQRSGVFWPGQSQGRPRLDHQERCSSSSGSECARNAAIGEDGSPNVA
jgi:hypothetical protein